ncbi:carbohydrate ABC transporter permease [Dactylosporangium sucinum]|uniref:Sugar ABC transporter permease n=1 Tax=Dactylosporangium sucinum TaxID=1424081 RepID=A0A917UB17_9ACTN|nr:carbohydrate ABC transporter permease [Dactylosporangium sucinum]GGM74304.1 sugar ABC transporter permease [Dactylosporangium sucinum]
MSRRLLAAVLAVGALLMIFPFVWTFVTSITAGGDVLTTPRLIPEEAGLDGYRKLFEVLPFWRITVNSLVLAVVSTALLLITSSTAAYAFARLDFPGKNVVFVAYLATLMIPMQVLVVPLFIEVRAFDLVDTYASLIVPTIASAFGVFLLRQSVAVLPRELDEAAFVDGAGHIRIFLRITLPLIRPALVTYGLFAFMSSWNAFLWPLVVIRSREFMTLPLGLASLSGEYTVQWNAIMAGSVVSIVPILALYAVAQQHIVQSVAQAGLK